VDDLIPDGTAPAVEMILRFDARMAPIRSNTSLIGGVARQELEKQALLAAHELQLFPVLSRWLTRVSGVAVPPSEEGFKNALADGVVLCAVVSLMKVSDGSIGTKWLSCLSACMFMFIFFLCV
jgi:hypothetical protein